MEELYKEHFCIVPLSLAELIPQSAQLTQMTLALVAVNCAKIGDVLRHITSSANVKGREGRETQRTRTIS